MYLDFLSAAYLGLKISMVQNYLFMAISFFFAILWAKMSSVYKPLPLMVESIKPACVGGLIILICEKALRE